MMGPSSASRRNRGVTLIELLISMTLGLVVTIAVINAYLGGSRAAQVAAAQARMNDDAASVLSLLGSHIRMAGNNPERAFRAASAARNPAYATPGGTAFAIRGCDGRFANVANAARIDDLACPASVAGAADSLAITYEADAFNTASTEHGNIPMDCVGFALDATRATVTVYDPVSGIPGPVEIDYYLGENRFYIAASPDGVPRLMCRGNGNGSQPGVLAENVEDLQLTIGLAPPAATGGSVAGYLSASEMAAHPALVGLTDAERWAKAVSVRICILMRSSQPVVHDAGSAKYHDCAGELVSPADLYLRRAYRTTVVLRGRV